MTTGIVLRSALAEIHVGTESTLVVWTRAAKVFRDVSAAAVVFDKNNRSISIFTRSRCVDAEIEIRTELTCGGRGETAVIRRASEFVAGTIWDFDSIDAHVQVRTKLAVSVMAALGRVIFETITITGGIRFVRITTVEIRAEVANVVWAV